MTAPKDADDSANASDLGKPKMANAAAVKRWLEANREAFDFWNADIEQHGLPLDRYRQF